MSLAIDPSFWSKERIKKFQREAKLTPDGIIGPMTKKSLLKKYGPSDLPWSSMAVGMMTQGAYISDKTVVYNENVPVGQMLAMENGDIMMNPKTSLIDIAKSVPISANKIMGLSPDQSSSFGPGAYVRDSFGRPIGQVMSNELRFNRSSGPYGMETIDMTLTLRCKASDITEMMMDDRQRMEERRESETAKMFQANVISEEELIKVLREPSNMPIIKSSSDTSVQMIPPLDPDEMTGITKRYLDAAGSAMSEYKQKLLYGSGLYDADGNAIPAEPTRFNVTEEDKANYIDPDVLANFFNSANNALNGNEQKVYQGKMVDKNGNVIGTVRDVTIQTRTQETVEKTEFCEPYSIAEFIEEVGTV